MKDNVNPHSSNEQNLAPQSSTSHQTEPKKWWQWFLVYPTILLALMGAMPTYYEMGSAYIKGVKAGDSDKAILSNKMWIKNFECTTLPYEPFVTPTNTEVDATICKSGDVLIKIRTANNEQFFEWVAVEKISRIKTAAIHFNLFNQAMASQSKINTTSSTSNNGVVVLCQKWIGPNLLLRRVQYQGRGCFDETINTYSGQVVKSIPAPCNC